MNSMYIKKVICDHELNECFKSIFHTENVTFSNYLESIENWNENGIYIVRYEIEGDFPLCLDIYPETNKDDKSLALEVSSYLKTEILVSDDSLNPYSWLLCADNKTRKVFVDEKFLDGKIGFIIRDQLIK